MSHSRLPSRVGRRWFFACFTAVAAVGVGRVAGAAEPAAWAERHLPELVELYRHLHAHPELSLHETATAERLAEELREAGLTVTTGVGGTGVVGVLENGPGPTVMVRTDLDALPVEEKTELVYASKVKVRDAEGRETGVMHACGHDIHITCLVGVARYLATHADLWSGRLICIGQPAEERGMGARAMLDAGLFTKFPKPDFALALHCDSKLPAGTVGHRSGYILANVDTVDIALFGRGGHGAHPHTTIDPVVIAAHLVVDLQSIVAREIKPGEPAVVTVGSIHGGTKHNIIGDRCDLQLTVRSYTDEVRHHLLDAIRRKAKAAALAAGAPEPKVTLGDGFTPATKNDDALTARLVPVWTKTFGEARVVEVPPSMGGEDFSVYGLAGVPICMFSLGTVEAQRLAGFERLKQAPPSLHSPFFYPDAEPTLRTGVTAMTAAVLHLMPSKHAAPSSK